MERNNKHFSHPHNLNLHKLPSAAVEYSCSGCNSCATDTVYACWPCNFILHEQCFRAARFLHHPSHPSHPLTLLPFPTYPSNSFVCNSCNQAGTGFTYCCSDCEFDLHVQCAYNISISSHLTPQTHKFPQQNQTPSFTTLNDLPIHYPLSNQEPIFNLQNAYLPHQEFTLQHISNPSPSAQKIPPSYNPQYASVSPQAPTNQPTASSHFQNYPYPSSHTPNFLIINETGLSLNAPQYSQIPQPSNNPQPIPSNHINYHPIKETVQKFNAPQNFQSPSQNPPMNEMVQNFNHIQNYPHPSHNPQPIPNNPIPTYHSMNETNPSLNAPQIPHTGSDESINSNVPMPISPLKADTSVNSNAMPPSKPDQLGQIKTREIMHFSHPHALILINRKVGEDPRKCSACEEIISGSRYSCSESGCDFHLDKSCFRYSHAINHKSHPEHPLTLLSYASDQHGQFICGACFKDGFGFMYHCTTCDFDLHIKCASIPETVKHDDHEHPLKLFYSCPIKGKEFTFCCDDCGGIVQENWWTYYCEECDYGTHVDCGNVDEETTVKESRDEESKSSTGDPVLDAQLQMQRLQLQAEIAHQTAQMMSNIGQSISNLAG